MRHYGLLDPQFRRVVSVFRIRIAGDGMYVERWDPEADAWMEGPGTLLRFVNEGENGAIEISKKGAERFIADGLPPLPAPVVASPG